MPEEFHELFDVFSMYRQTEESRFLECKGTDNIFCRFALDFGPCIGRFDVQTQEYEN